MRVEDGFFFVDKSPRGYALRHPVKIPVSSVLAVKERGLVSYIVRAFASDRPSLISLVFENHSLVRLARHFLRHCSGSPMSLYAYTDTVSRYSRFLENSPDMIINDAKAGGNIMDPVRAQNHIGFLEEYLANLQDNGLSPGRVHGEVKHIRTWYRTNGVSIKLGEPLSRRVTYKDRAPTPEEVLRLLEVASLREKVIVSMICLGGFRESTLAMLQYRHVREDIEKSIVPIHIHVDANETKGKYADYDTYIGAEAAEYLKLYLNNRRRGSPEWTKDGTRSKDRRPPEELTDTSSLIRDENSLISRPIGPKQIRKMVHNLYIITGLVKAPKGRMYDVRVHSLRKYFKTQLVAHGVPESFVDYFMGHKLDTYNDIQSLGIEKLREVYTTADIAIRPRTKISKMETIKEMIRALGENPEQILSREALAKGATTHLDPANVQEHQLQVLYEHFQNLMHQVQNQRQAHAAP